MAYGYPENNPYLPQPRQMDISALLQANAPMSEEDVGALARRNFLADLAARQQAMQQQGAGTRMASAGPIPPQTNPYITQAQPQPKRAEQINPVIGAAPQTMPVNPLMMEGEGGAVTPSAPLQMAQVQPSKPEINPVIGAAPQKPAAEPGVVDGIMNDPASLNRALLEFGLATMAAGSQPGANLMTSLGHGGMAALGGYDRRQQAAAQQKLLERRENRQDRALNVDEAQGNRRLNLTEEEIRQRAKQTEAELGMKGRSLDETGRHNRAMEGLSAKELQLKDKAVVKDGLAKGLSVQQSIVNLAQDYAKNDASSYKSDVTGLDNPMLDPAGYEANVKRHMERIAKEFGVAPPQSGQQAPQLPPGFKLLSK